MPMLTAWPLQEENTQLRETLGRYSSAVDLIMTKHRSQISDLVKCLAGAQKHEDDAVLRERRRSEALETEVVNLTGQLERAQHIMCLAIEADADRDDLATRELGQLRTETVGLRDMLGLSSGAT